MLFREIIAVYCENHTEHVNTLCGQNVKANGVCSYHSAINNQTLIHNVVSTLHYNVFELLAKFN
jgi:hypothetical protein